MRSERNPGEPGTFEEIELETSDATLHGDLAVPGRAAGLVLFAHGSGSSRLSPRNRRVAGHLFGKGFATLLFDLLTAQEERADRETGRFRFDTERLAGRLRAVTAWAARQPRLGGMAYGYFGASTGASAALIAAASTDRVKAVVSRGGRPDLAGDALPFVKAATLLIVGGRDEEVLALNRSAYEQLGGRRSLVVVPGATHLFEEPGALEEVSRLAAGWFSDHLAIPEFPQPDERGEAFSRGERGRRPEEVA
jgi:putative phosphoribosyl transferase